MLGRGSKLIGGTVSVEVDRASVAGLLVDGFFPRCQIGDHPQQRRASGFQEIGLPFESDTAITRHLAAFLVAQADANGAVAYPTHVLFNGGVFKAEALRARDCWMSWATGVVMQEATKLLEGVHDLDHAVAAGRCVLRLGQRTWGSADSGRRRAFVLCRY